MSRARRRLLSWSISTDRNFQKRLSRRATIISKAQKFGRGDSRHSWARHRAWKYSGRDNTTRGFPVSRGARATSTANADESRRNSSRASTVKPCKREEEREEKSRTLSSQPLTSKSIDSGTIAYLCVSTRVILSTMRARTIRDRYCCSFWIFILYN